MPGEYGLPFQRKSADGMFLRGRQWILDWRFRRPHSVDCGRHGTDGSGRTECARGVLGTGHRPATITAMVFRSRKQPRIRSRREIYRCFEKSRCQRIAAPAESCERLLRVRNQSGPGLRRGFSGTRREHYQCPKRHLHVLLERQRHRPSGDRSDRSESGVNSNQGPRSPPTWPPPMLSTQGKCQRLVSSG